MENSTSGNSIGNTVEPPNKGHVGTRSFVLYREVSFIWRLKCTGIIGIGMNSFVLYRQVSFIWSVLNGGSIVYPYSMPVGMLEFIGGMNFLGML